MKRVFAGLLLCSAWAVWGQASDTEFKKAMKRFDEITKAYGPIRPEVPPAPEPQKPKLGPIDQWRYDSCRSDAAKAPTSQGVYAGMHVCRERFGQ